MKRWLFIVWVCCACAPADAMKVRATFTQASLTAEYLSAAGCVFVDLWFLNGPGGGKFKETVSLDGTQEYQCDGVDTNIPNSLTGWVSDYGLFSVDGVQDFLGNQLFLGPGSPLYVGAGYDAMGGGRAALVARRRSSAAKQNSVGKVVGRAVVPSTVVWDTGVDTVTAYVSISDANFEGINAVNVDIVKSWSPVSVMLDGFWWGVSFSSIGFVVWAIKRGFSSGVSWARWD
jgi:hypothetical protein